MSSPISQLICSAKSATLNQVKHDICAIKKVILTSGISVQEKKLLFNLTNTLSEKFSLDIELGELMQVLIKCKGGVKRGASSSTPGGKYLTDNVFDFNIS